MAAYQMYSVVSARNWFWQKELFSNLTKKERGVMYSFLLMQIFVLGLITAFAFCVWFVWNGARSLVRHEALRKEFKTAFMLRDVFTIVFAGISASVLLMLAEMLAKSIDLRPEDVLDSVLPIMAVIPILIVVVSRIHQVFSKLKWAIEMDRLQKLSGVLMTSAQPIAGSQSKMFSVYRNDCEAQSFTVRDESVSEKLKTLLDQRVTVFYAGPSGECLPVARFVAPDGEAMSERSIVGGRYESKF